MFRSIAGLFLWSVAVIGCAAAPKRLVIEGASVSVGPGAIVSGETGETVSFDELMADLKSARIIYVGEQHTHPAHHDIQLRILKALHAEFPDLTVGMEMFDVSYQEILNQWSAGALDEDTFLKKVHWYANWKYDASLYRDILAYVKDRHIGLAALNIPFCIPPKIAVGGIDTLSADEKKYLPSRIDTSDPEHRSYVQEIHRMHHVRGREDFENFYAAQCAWEDGMAEAVARNARGSKMLVFVGNGHIYRKFGVPDRAFARTGSPFRTVYPIGVGNRVNLSDADYIWVTDDPDRPNPLRSHGPDPHLRSRPALR